MSKKRDNLFERYVDKAVLGIVTILGLWLLWAFVLGSPYAEQYDGQKLGPGEIDSYIAKNQVPQLLAKLDEPAKPRVYGRDRSKEFAAKLACSISNRISDNLYIPIPGYGYKVSAGDRIYRVPLIPDIGGADVERIRSVAYVPVEPVGVDNPYTIVAAELGDIDFVTVEASFDVTNLYENFEDSFAGRSVRKDWQDKNLAKPVFAAVALERRRLLDDGSFGDWQEVERTKIDSLKKMLGDVPDKVDDKHTVSLLMVKFDEFYVQKNILQPGAYDFAASNESWLTPGFHKEYKKLLKQEADRLRREQQQFGGVGGIGNLGARGIGIGGRSDNIGGRLGAGGRGGSRTGTRDRRTTTGRRGGDDRSRRGQTDRTTNPDRTQEAERRKKKERTSADVYKDFQKTLITEKTNLARLREPLVFWAHDDSIVPGERYQYRTRLGVFNPIAGRDWFREDEKHFKEEPILWSQYSYSYTDSNPTETIDIPMMLHFFPLDMAAAEDKSVNVKVAKFHLGKWRSENFKVQPGEMSLSHGIGAGDSDSDAKMEVIDYTTGAAMLDVVQASGWMGVNVLRQRDFWDVLYTKDDANIEHLAVKNRNWPEELQQLFNEIKAAESEVVTLQNRGIEGLFDMPGQFGGRPDMPGMPGRPGMPGGRIGNYGSLNMRRRPTGGTR